MNHDDRNGSPAQPTSARFSQCRSIWEKHKEPLLVWSVFMLACVALLYHTYNATGVFPASDEWPVLHTLFAEYPVTLEWLWSQHNEHRIFLPRLGIKLLAWCSNLDEKWMTSCLALLGCASAFLVMVGLRTIRGRTSYLDILPAFALLHWGNTNYHYSFQLTLVLPVFLFLVLVTTLILWLEKHHVLSMLIAGTALLSLPLCGGAMLPAACLFALYFVYCAWKIYSREKRRLFALVVGFFPLATYALVFFYFVDYIPPKRPATPGLWASFQGGLGVLSNAFGVFPAISVYLALLLLFTSLVVFAGLVLKAIHDLGHRDRCIVLLIAGCSTLALAFCIGHSRIGLTYPAIYMGERYTTLLAPLFFVLWAGFATVYSPNARPSLQVLLACVILLTVGANYQAGYGYMKAVRERNTRILIDAHIMNERAGEFYATKYPQAFGPWKVRAAPLIEELRDRQLGAFSPKVRQRFLKSFLPYLHKRVRLSALHSRMNRNPVPEDKQVRLNHDSVLGWSLYVIPPAEAVVQIPPQASTVEVEFGVYPFAYRQPNNPDVEFRVSIQHGDGRVEPIWSRCLEPLLVVADRGSQRVSIAVPPVGPGARLITQVLRGKRPDRDWAYLSDFQVLDANRSVLAISPAVHREAPKTAQRPIRPGGFTGPQQP